MSKGTQTSQEDGSSGKTEGRTAAARPEPERPQVKPRESKVHKISPEPGLYTPQKRERTADVLLTVDQYLRKAALDKAISDLVRALNKTKVMYLADWERETAALLKKKTW